MKAHCKKCNAEQDCEILWEKVYPKDTTFVLKCTVCSDRFLEIRKPAPELPFPKP